MTDKSVILELRVSNEQVFESPLKTIIKELILIELKLMENKYQVLPIPPLDVITAT